MVPYSECLFFAIAASMKRLCAYGAFICVLPATASWCQTPSSPASSDQPGSVVQTVPADASHPKMVIHSDKPLTPEEEAKLKAQMESMRKLPPANPLVPGFEIEWPDGKKISIADLHGKVVLLDYWATWCAPCVEGLPELDAVYRNYRDNPNVAILAVNPLMGDTPEKVQSFFQQHRLTVPLAYDKRFGKAAVTREGSAPTMAFSLPVLLLLDRDGKQQWFETGGEVGDTEHAMQKLLIAKIDAQLKRP